MKIIVCMKQVPATTQVEIDPETGSMKRSGSSTRTNPYDLLLWKPLSGSGRRQGAR